MKLDQSLKMAFATDPGRVRSHNEDSVALDAAAGLVVLADGMGGNQAGEVASAIAVTRIFCETRAGLATLVQGQIDRESGLRYESLVMRDAMRRANEEIHDLATRGGEYDGMATTVVAALFSDNHLTCAHAGDSRMYAFCHGELEQLTCDHTVVRELLDTGMYSPDEARAAVNAGLVTRALGVLREVEVEILERPVRAGDVFLLCSDGLTNMVSEDRVAQTLAGTDDLDACAEQLVRLANKGGGDDNVSVALIKVVGDYAAKRDWQAMMVDWFDR